MSLSLSLVPGRWQMNTALSTYSNVSQTPAPLASYTCRVSLEDRAFVCDPEHGNAP